jgi:hypothetical protein
MPAPVALWPGFLPMTDKTDETGKGPSGPGEAPKRPYATIDLQATEIGRARDQATAAGRGKPDAEAAAQPPSAWNRLLMAGATAAGWLVAAGAWIFDRARRQTVLSHMAAGVAGAALTLAASALVWLLTAGAGGERVPPDLGKRLATIEKTLAQRPALPDDAKAKLAAAETRLAKIEERVQAAHAKLAAETQALDARLSAQDATERIGKLEAALAARPAGEPATTTAAADMAKLAGEASAAKAAADRGEQELAALKGEAQSLRLSLDALKGSVEDRLKDTAKAGDLAPLQAKLGAYERELGAVLRTEGERTASSRQVLLTLELASLKRALDRGDSYVRELDAVRRAAAGSIDLAALDRSSHTGLPTLGALAQDFRRIANAATDAEREQPDASVLDRLMAGARSVVRLRKASHDADDMSVEATLGRMESALKDGNVGEVLAQGKRLPPKAALAAEDWLRKLEARHAADRAVAEIEAALKASLGRGAGPEAK